MCAPASSCASASRRPTGPSAEAAVAEMCRRLLANPVMETADWELRADEAAAVEVGA